MGLTVQSDSPYCLHLLQCTAVLYTQLLSTALVLNYHSSCFLNKCLIPIKDTCRAPSSYKYYAFCSKTYLILELICDLCFVAKEILMCLKVIWESSHHYSSSLPPTHSLKYIDLWCACFPEPIWRQNVWIRDGNKWYLKLLSNLKTVYSGFAMLVTKTTQFLSQG